MNNVTANNIGFGCSGGSGELQGKSVFSPLLLVWVFSFIYGGFLSSLPLDVFKDRAYYLIYAEYSWDIWLHYWDGGLLVCLVNEPLWLFINIGLSAIFSPEGGLRIIIFFSATVVALNILRQDTRYLGWLIVFLLLPQVLTYHIVLLRQGLAMAFFLIGWFSSNRIFRRVLFFVVPFIHSVFFFVISLLILTKVAKKLHLGANLRTVLFVGLGVGVGVALGWVAALLGARQANEYLFIMADISGLGFIFWSVVLSLMFLQGNVFLRNFSFELGSIVFYLTTYFLFEVTARIFESTLLLVLLAGLRLTSWRRLLFLMLIVSYIVLQYLGRLKDPWFGFGLS